MIRTRLEQKVFFKLSPKGAACQTKGLLEVCEDIVQALVMLTVFLPKDSAVEKAVHLFSVLFEPPLTLRRRPASAAA